MTRITTLLALALFTGCTGTDDDDGKDTDTDASDTDVDTDTDVTVDDPCADATTANCVAVGLDDDLLEVVNAIDDDTTIVLAAGTYDLANQVSIRADDVILRGAGIDVTILDFADQEAQSNGVDYVGSGFTIEDLTVANAKKDGIRVEDSDRVVFRRVKTTWDGGPLRTNGAYGIYPVKCTDVLIEDSESWYASDAGIYVGQSRHVVVRNNLAKGNVAGMEIENTQYADVYGNTAEENTAGLVVFDLPGNPVVGRDVRIHDNIVRNNNQANFAPGGTVAAIPSGTGTFAMASRRVVIEDNTYENNGSFDIAVISGLVIEGDPATWALTDTDLVGDWDDLGLISDGSTVFNFRSENILVRNNTHTGSGTDIDDGDLLNRELGVLLGLLYADEDVDDVLYDAIGESSFDPTDAGSNSNDNHICIGDVGASFASLDLATLADRFAELDVGTTDDLFRPPSPFTPFDCTALLDGDVIAPTVTVD